MINSSMLDSSIKQEFDGGTKNEEINKRSRNDTY